MSDVGFMEKLLDGAGVEFLPLSTFAKVVDGTHQTPKYTDSGVPFVSVQNIKSLRDTAKRISISDFEKFKYKPAKGDIFMTRIGDIGTCALVENDDPLAYYVTLALIRVDKGVALPGYISHFLQSDFGKVELYKRTLIHAVPIKINLGEIGKLPIPIPCPDDPAKSLAIQGEIVRILDSFTELTAELTAGLTAELAARKTQYNHYCAQLLTFTNCEVEWKALGQIGSFRYGLAAKAKDAGDARFVRISDINGDGKLSTSKPKFVDVDKESRKFFLSKSDLLMARTGATYGKTMLYEGDEPAIFAGFLIKLDLDPEIIDPRYYWHFAQSAFFWDQANSLVSGGGQPQFNANALKVLKVILPYPDDPERSLLEQARVVSILDKYDAITASISAGLPREIALRQHQYEYYRNLLLSFPKPEEAAEA